MMKKTLLFSCLVLLVCSCHFLKRKTKEVPLAKVYDEYLYASDLKGIVPPNTQQADSLAIVKNYVESWVKKQLILQRAELNLSDEDKDVQKQIDEYRSSLLIFKYQQQLTKQKLDTLVTSQEIENYFKENAANFLLNDIIVRGLFVKLPVNAPKLNDFSTWLAEDNLEKLQNYCYQYAKKYDYFNDQWVSFSVIQAEMPLRVEDPEVYLKNNKLLTTNDNQFHYFFRIKEIHFRGEASPFAYVKDRVKDIILSKRKIKFIHDLENNLYNDELDHGNVKIY
jgi:hypothetical protein